MKLQKMFNLRTLTMALVFGLLVLAAAAQAPGSEHRIEANGTPFENHSAIAEPATANKPAVAAPTRHFL